MDFCFITKKQQFCVLAYPNPKTEKSRFDLVKVVRHIEMPKAVPKTSICHFQKLEMILKWYAPIRF